MRYGRIEDDRAGEDYALCSVWQAAQWADKFQIKRSIIAAGDIFDNLRPSTSLLMAARGILQNQGGFYINGNSNALH